MGASGSWTKYYSYTLIFRWICSSSHKESACQCVRHRRYRFNPVREESLDTLTFRHKNELEKYKGWFLLACGALVKECCVSVSRRGNSV